MQLGDDRRERTIETACRAVRESGCDGIVIAGVDAIPVVKRCAEALTMKAFVGEDADAGRSRPGRRRGYRRPHVLVKRSVPILIALVAAAGCAHHPPPTNVVRRMAASSRRRCCRRRRSRRPSAPSRRSTSTSPASAGTAAWTAA
jgi:hypothetical protein